MFEREQKHTFSFWIIPPRWHDTGSWILPQVRQELTYSTQSILWLLMSVRHAEPRHQQPLYWRCWTELSRFPHVIRLQRIFIKKHGNFIIKQSKTIITVLYKYMRNICKYQCRIIILSWFFIFLILAYIVFNIIPTASIYEMHNT